MTFDDVEVVQRRSERLGALLRRTDAQTHSVPFPAERIARAQRHATVVRWRIAAMIALLIGGAAGVPPVRAWIVDTARSVWLSVTGARAGDAQPHSRTDAPPSTASTAGAVIFPVNGQLLVRITSRQASGSLSLEPATGRAVSASVIGDNSGVELAVQPDGLRIGNSRSSNASYVIRVPAGVSRIVVQIEQENERVFNPPTGSDRYTVDVSVRSAAGRALK